MNIVVKRAGALGDVLCVSPVIRRLRKEFPHASIFVETGNPEAFYLNPDTGGPMMSPTINYDLNLAYEKRPDMHVVEAYMQEVFGDDGAGHDLSMYLHHKKRWRIYGKKPVLIHASASWPNRTFTNHFWDSVAIGFSARNQPVLFIGRGRDYRGPVGYQLIDNAIDALDIHEVAGLMSESQLVIGSDSAMLHVAGTTDTPIIGLYTCARAAYRMPFRHGVLGWNMVGLEPDLGCIGCLARVPPPTTSYSCERGDNICVSMISPVRILMEAEQFLAPSQQS